jgi:hypothetical protein
MISPAKAFELLDIDLIRTIDLYLIIEELSSSDNLDARSFSR